VVGLRRLGFHRSSLQRVADARKRNEINVMTNIDVEELRNLYSSPNIVRVIKLRRVRWAEHVACI
jgi:hypothetical protein